MTTDIPDWLVPGARVIWQFRPAGRGEAIPTPAIVRKVHRKRVTIAVAVQGGREIRVTSRSYLSPRTAPARELGEI